MNTADIRKSNLLALAEIHGASVLSRKLGYRQPSFLSQMIGPNPTRGVSEKSAREYERALGLEEGYLDRPLFGSQQLATSDAPISETPGAAQASTQLSPIAQTDEQSVNVAFIADTIRTLNRIMQAEKTELNVDKFSKLLTLAILDASEHGFKVRETRVKQTLELIK